MTPKYFDNKGRLNDVVIIRSIAIIMVVAFHAYYMMMVDGHFPESAQMYHSMYFNLNCMILQFRMPLFIFISGYLFSHLENDRGKYATFKGLLSNKFKRLIIPFFVFATVFMISINNFSWRPYYTWGYDHLWFIPMLFWCFIFTRIQSFVTWSKATWWKITVLSVFLVFNIIPQIQTPLFGLPNFLRWYFWFYFGYQLYLNRDAAYHALNKHKLLYTIVLIGIYAGCIYAKCTLLSDNSIHTWYTEFGNIAIVLLLWYWINNLLFSKLMGGVKIFEKLNKYSYGIYVFHNWLQPFMISSTAIALFGLDSFAIGHPILFPLAFTVSSFVLSLAVTWLLLKTRTGRFLIG